MDFIPYFKMQTTKEEKKAVLEVLDSGWLTTGKKALQFEQEFLKITGFKYALAVNSATSGLHLSLCALNIKKGDKILTSPYTFVSTSEVIHYLDAEPVFCDIKENTYHLDPQKVECALQKNDIKAVIYISVTGYNLFEKEIFDICKKYQVPLISDSAHSFPAYDKSGFHGSNSNIAVYSFYANKTLTTAEGGMILTNNKDYYEKMKALRLHGISKDVFQRYSSDEVLSYKYDVVQNGFKYNLTDIAAALGLAQLKTVKENMQKRKFIARSYAKAFSNLKEISLPVGYSKSDESENSHSFHIFAIRLNFEFLTSLRDEFMTYITKNYNIGLSVHFIPIHTFTYYKNRYNYKNNDYPFAVNEFEKSISLPIFPSMSQDQINRVIQAVTETANHFSK